MAKRIFNIVLAAAAALAVLCVISQMQKKSQKDALLIDKTDTVIQELKKKAELTTAHFHEETFLISEQVDKGVLLDTKKRIVITIGGDVEAGFDLKGLDSTNIIVKNDTIVCRLNAPVITDIKLNPSDYEVFDCTGTWTHDEIIQILEKQAKEKLAKDAIENGLMESAKESSKSFFENFFKSLGFKHAEITFRQG